SQRASFAVCAHGQREVAEEALGGRLDQMAKAAPLLLATEFELRRVVRDDNPRQLCRPPTRLAEVRRKNRVRRHLVVAEEAVGGLQLGVIQRLREALRGSFGKAVHQKSQAPIEALVAEIGVNGLRG